MDKRETIYVHPEFPGEMDQWAKKWGVSRQEVYDAILHTGCLEADQLKKYVHRNRWIYHPVSSTTRLLKAGINLIF